jgi:hypothetical protein
LREENLEFDDVAIEALVDNNPGDLRALVRDLQVLSSSATGTITEAMVANQAHAGRRDTSEGVFPGLDKLYRATEAEEAVRIGRSIEKSPPDMVNWIHWNNAALFPKVDSVARGNRSLSIASKMYMGQFRSTAHRSWYWSGQLASLSASVTNTVPFTSRIYPSYPNFLRRQSTRTRPSILKRMGSYSGMSSSALREEILPLLSALLKDSPQLGDSEDFALSLNYGFSGEEHASLAGLPPSRKATKQLIAKYDAAYEEKLSEQIFEPLKIEEVEPEPLEHTEEKKDEEKGSSNGQMKLF